MLASLVLKVLGAECCYRAFPAVMSAMSEQCEAKKAKQMVKTKAIHTVYVTLRWPRKNIP
jgi:hypothetical protein